MLINIIGPRGKVLVFLMKKEELALEDYGIHTMFLIQSYGGI